MSGTGAVGDVTREALHHRRIDMQAFRRSDGLYELVGRVIDTKPHDHTPPAPSRTVKADEPIHDISLTLVYDAGMIVRDVRTEFRANPYAICPESGAAMRVLIGLRIGPGWNSEARKRLANSERCTHLAELLAPMATTALQGMSVMRMSLPDAVDSAGRPFKVDSCYAYGAGRELVQHRWPEFFVPESGN